MRLGTYGLPAVFEVLDEPVDTDAARRLTGVLADVLGKPLRVAPGASVDATRATVDAWRAWWFAEKLEYETLNEATRSLGRVTETRYGRWLARALAGRLGPAAATGRSIDLELRERLPASVFIAGLGGLLATALVVAFGGGSALRRRPLGIKVVDLVGALLPGLGAFLLGFAALAELCAAPRPVGALLGRVFASWPRIALAVPLLASVAVLWLRRRRARVLLHAVRHEAESWVRESRDPHLGQLARHGLRVGVASLFAPLGLSALALFATTTVVEPLAGVRGMGALTLASLRHFDAPWILVALVTVVPLFQGGRWARLLLVWALGDPSDRPRPEDSVIPALATGARPDAVRPAAGHARGAKRATGARPPVQKDVSRA